MSQTPHKHSAIIKAWADGATVEYKVPGRNEFNMQRVPGFDGVGEYRIKPAPDKWADLKVAHKAGSVIQYRDVINPGPYNSWVTTPSPMWLTHDGAEYRIEPDKYAALKAAAAAGKIIQTWLSARFPWVDDDSLKGFLWNVGVTNCRIKPETVSYRLAIVRYRGGAPFVCNFDTSTEETAVEKSYSFVRWLGERKEVEV